MCRQELACVVILREELGLEPEGTGWFVCLFFCSPHWPPTWSSPATVSRVLGLQMCTVTINYNFRLKRKSCVSVIVNAGMCVRGTGIGQMRTFGGESSSFVELWSP